MMLWICDVHGVLVDSTAVVREAFAATAARYRFPCGEAELHEVKGLGLVEAYGILDPGGDTYTRRAFHVQHVRARIDAMPAFAGVRDTLAAARARGIRVGAATSHGEIAEACLVNTGLYPLIDVLVTQEEVRRPKPHPDSILRAIHLLGGDPRDTRLEALHIGDTAADVVAGKRAGILTVGVTCGMSDGAEMRLAGPDYVVDAFHEMRWWLPASSPPMQASGLTMAGMACAGEPSRARALANPEC
jgi:HAD superfamily hydrolase (TIGR01509 family)